MYPRGNPNDPTNRGTSRQQPIQAKEYPRSMLNPGPRTVSSQPSDEQRRRKQEADKLIADCYSKIIGDNNGRRYHETTYQTHLPVTEYSAFPSHPPPENTPTNQLGSIKDRVLVICVKHSGRLMIQKGKFNKEKNIYQIGRTWDMDELKSITNVGNNGILLLLNKDYYWRVEEGAERIWKFARFLTSVYGNFMKRYPILNGFSIEEFKLPPIQDKRSGVSSLSSIKNTSESSMASRDSNKPNMQGVKRSNDVKADDIYKEFDFTSNGKLPVKPMIIMDRANSSSDARPTDLRTSIPNTFDNESIVTNNDDTGSFIFKTKQSQSPHTAQKLHEYVQSDENLETSPLRNFKPKRPSQDYQAQQRQVSDSLESVAAVGVQLQEQLGNNVELSRKNTIPRDNIILRQNSQNESIPNNIPSSMEIASLRKSSRKALHRKEKSLDYGIEEVSDDSEKDVFKDPEVVSLSDMIDESTKLDADKVDTSIQELENFVDSQLKGSKERKPSLKVRSNDVINNKENLQSNDANNGVKSENIEPIEQAVGYALDEDEEIFNANVEKYITSDKNKTVEIEFETKKDPDIEELLEEVNWSLFESSDKLINGLTKELNTIKQKNVKQLVSLDFSNFSVSNDFKTSVVEIENLTNIFKQMELEIKLLTPEISKIENNSQGLQVKSINEKALYNDLRGILDKVVINNDDLKSIESFDDFENFNKLQLLESQLLHLYNALSTVGHENSDVRDVLGSMKALKQYQKYYEQVSLTFIENFSNFIKHEIDFIIQQASETIKSFHANSIFRLLNNVLIYSSITYFIKDIFPAEFDKLKNYIINKLSQFLDRFIHSKIESIKTKFKENTTIGSNLAKSLEEHTLKKSRTLRFSRKDKLRGKLGIGEVDPKTKDSENQSNLVKSSDDMKTIVSVIEYSEQLICIIQYFLGNILHYDASIINFNEYLSNYSFSNRYSLLEISTFEQVGGKSYTNELILSMNMVFGSYINAFLKNIAPNEANIPALLVYLQNEFEGHKGNNEEFLVFSFLGKAIEKYKSLWSKYILTQIDFLNKSTIVAKCGILPAIKNVNHLIMLTESSLEGLGGLNSPTPVRMLLDKSYAEITEVVIHLFMRDDPLLKSHDFDDKEREQRNVSIIQNIFYISDQLSVFELESVKKMTSQLNAVLKKAQDNYFEKLLSKHIGKLIEFVNNYDALSKMNRTPKEYNKKYVKSLVSSYTSKDISMKVTEIYRKLEKHFISGNDMFEKDLLEKLWHDMETQFVFYFVKLDEIIKTKFDMDIDYTITKQEIHSIFTSIH